MPQNLDPVTPRTSTAQDTARIALGLTLVVTGTSHLTVAREPFKAQVPPWLPLDPDLVVLQSGAAEIALGTSLLVLPRMKPSLKPLLGCVAGAFFTAIFPGNVAQYTNRRNGFGLDTDRKRLGRLFFQPLLVAWALWSTGALSAAPPPPGGPLE